MCLITNRQANNKYDVTVKYKKKNYATNAHH